MEQLFFYKNFGKDIFHCERCGCMTVVDNIEDEICVYRASESKDDPAVVLGKTDKLPELVQRIRGGECPVCAGWQDRDGKQITVD